MRVKLGCAHHMTQPRVTASKYVKSLEKGKEMRRVKQLLAFALTLAMAFAIALPALAEGESGEDQAATNSTGGTITIENATKGITYKAYKLFDVTYNGDNVAYKVPATKKDSISTDIFNVSDVADSDGNYSFWVKDNIPDDEVIAWVKRNYNTFAGTAINGAESSNSTYVFSNLTPGYYYVTSSLGSVVTIDTAAPSQTIKDKNDSTTTKPEKTITAEDGVGLATAAETNDAGVGSKESFEVNFNAVNWITTTTESGDVTTTQAKAWKFTDTPTGLSIDANTVKVYVTDAGAEKEITDTITDKSVSDSGVLTFNIPWIDDGGNSLYQPKTAADGDEQTAHIPVRVTYDATITAAAAVNVAPNKVEVKYTNSSNQDVPIGTDETNTYTYKFVLKKTDGSNNELYGAKFELYKGSVTADNLVKFTVKDNEYTVASNGTVTEIDLTTVATATIIGLDKTDYVLHESVVPDGYNQAADKTDVKNNLVKVNDTISDSNGTVTVINNKGTVMPSTGGIGTTIFYIVGGVMVAGAAIFLLTKRRMSGSAQ